MTFHRLVTSLLRTTISENPVESLTDASSEGVIFNMPEGSGGTCSGHLGRDCEVNGLEGSGDFPARQDGGTLSALAGYTSYIVEPTPREMYRKRLRRTVALAESNQQVCVLPVSRYRQWAICLLSNSVFSGVINVQPSGY